MTAIKATKMFIAIAPVAFEAYEGFKASGPRGAGDVLVKSYTGYSIQDKNFDLSRAAVGIVPIAAAWIFGKLASRVLR